VSTCNDLRTAERIVMNFILENVTEICWCVPPFVNRR
jgi:hypothetical protein